MTRDEALLGTAEADFASALVALQHELSACVDLEQMRALLARELVALLPVADRVSILFLDPGGDTLRIHRILPCAPAAARDDLPRLRVEGTPAGRVAREGVGCTVADVRADPNITFGHASHDGIRSTVSVPLRIGTRVVGVMNAGSRTVGACTDDMLPRMAQIASVVGPAFHAAEAFADATGARSRACKLVGDSAAFQAMLATARRAARSSADVLITGETGVGKTAIARALHAWSPRRAGPFVTVHLADLTPTLVESELFGYERGAFTGASSGRIGRFESAAGGTIFLDEISETPPAIQVKLLRVLQDRCFERVGGGRTIEANVRVIAATNADLRAAVARREFREDLYFRLAVVPLSVPPLRERREDLELLARAILARIEAADGRVRTLSPSALARMRAYAWPGNIRELESVLHRATILEESDELELHALGTPTENAIAISDATLASLPGQSWPTLDEHERAYIARVLELHHGMIEGERGAARVLGVPPSTLRSRMKRLGVSVPRTKGRTR